MPLDPTDQRHVTAAEGYLALGMYLDADGELEQVQPNVRHVAEVLAVRVGIYGALEKWELMLTVARRLALYDPDNVQWAVSLAYATRRAETIEAAKALLLSAVERHPKEAILHYNLACYECQLGDLEIARARLSHAFNTVPTTRQSATCLPSSARATSADGFNDSPPKGSNPETRTIFIGPNHSSVCAEPIPQRFKIGVIERQQPIFRLKLALRVWKVAGVA